MNEKYRTGFRIERKVVVRIWRRDKTYSVLGPFSERPNYTSAQRLRRRSVISYKYMWEGFGLYPVCTIDLQQRTHVIAYGCITTEHTSIQQRVLKLVKKYVEKVVNERMLKGRAASAAAAATSLV